MRLGINKKFDTSKILVENGSQHNRDITYLINLQQMVTKLDTFQSRELAGSKKEVPVALKKAKLGVWCPTKISIFQTPSSLLFKEKS